MRTLPSPKVAEWLAANSANIFHNGQGTTIIVNNPTNLFIEMQETMAIRDLWDEDVRIDCAVILSTANLPVPVRAAGNTKLDPATIAAVNADLNDNLSTVEIAKRFNVSRRTISRIKNGHRR